MLLLDTHAWFWVLSEPGHLSGPAQATVTKTPSDQIAVSAISLWELSLLFTRGHIQLRVTPDEWFDAALSHVQAIPLSPPIALGAYRLPGDFHRDPADRLIVATARHLNATLLTKDQAIRDYPHVKTVW